MLKTGIAVYAAVMLGLATLFVVEDVNASGTLTTEFRTTISGPSQPDVDLLRSSYAYSYTGGDVDRVSVSCGVSQSGRGHRDGIPDAPNAYRVCTVTVSGKLTDR